MTRRKRWSFFMGPLDHRAVRWADDFYRGEFTGAGRALFWGMNLSGMLLMGGLQEPLLLCFGFCTSALTFAGILGFACRPRLRMTRHITTFPSAGELFSYRVDVENTGKRMARNIVVEERRLPPDLRPSGDPPVIESLAPGERTSVTLRLKCLSRDCYQLNRLQGATTYPMGLVKSGHKSRKSDRLVVYPRVTQLHEFEIPHARNHQPGGIAVASYVGESTEFLGTRDWRQGDRLRDIHWPSSARVGRLIAKEFQEEYFVRLAVVLDVETLRARDEPCLERAISLTAGITDSLSRREYIVDIFAAGDAVYHFQAGRAIAHLENILEILASLEAGDRLDVLALQSVLFPEASRLSAVILVMMDWDRQRSELVKTLKSYGVAVRVICMKTTIRPDELDESELIAVPA